MNALGKVDMDIIVDTPSSRQRAAEHEQRASQLATGQSSLSVHILYMYIYMCDYAYIYMNVYMYIYMRLYIYVYTICMYIHIIHLCIIHINTYYTVIYIYIY